MSTRRQQIKFWVQPFSKGWRVEGSALLALRRGRNSNPVAPRAQPKTGKRRPAGRPRSPRPQFRRNCGMTHHYSIQSVNPRQRVEAFLRFPRWRGFCLVGGGGRTASCGEPLDRVPHGKTSHRDVLPPFLIFWVSFGVFRPLRRARRGAAPPPCQPFEKGGRKLSLPRLRKISYGQLKSSPRSLSRGYRSMTRGSRPRRHGSGDTPPAATWGLWWSGECAIIETLQPGWPVFGRKSLRRWTIYEIRYRGRFT